MRRIWAQVIIFLLASMLLPALSADSLEELLEVSFKDKGQATVERLIQDEIQKLCSIPRAKRVDDQVLEERRKIHLDEAVFPENRQFLGDWKQGEKVARNGRGLQSNDDKNKPNGGNCYACHQLDPEELAYGTLGPSLTNYGARGQSEPVLRYTWIKLWDTHAYNTCSHMPRFGAQGILSEQQLKDVMSYLLDPDSPVNASVQ